MSRSILDFIGFFSGLCSIIALLLYLTTVPKPHRTWSLLTAALLIAVPMATFLGSAHAWVTEIAIALGVSAATLFSYSYGRNTADLNRRIPDVLLVSHKRTSGQEWILGRIAESHAGMIEIDCFGVKLDALYKILKGVSSKSKLPHDTQITMRALLLEANSFGVKSRARLEGNDKVLRDVALMRDVYAKLVKEYKRHPHHRLTVKTYEFTPGFYILRVNDRMLIGTYLAESGYDCLCFHLQRHDGAVFNQFMRFFDTVWNTYSKNVLTAAPKSQAV